MDEKEAGKTKEGASSPKHIFLPPTALIVRESTDFFSVNDELVASALAFIAVHGHRPISAADVARGVATSLRSLQRRFQKILGRPIAAQIRRTRIERAKRELTQSKLSIKSIAASVGFGDAMRMYQVFCRDVGVSPKAYRSQRQAHDET
jgi:LacI family transcriptional regulator